MEAKTTAGSNGQQCACLLMAALELTSDYRTKRYIEAAIDRVAFLAALDALPEAPQH